MRIGCRCGMFGTRRQFLAALGTTGATTSAGCSLPVLSSASNQPIGESVSRNGIRATFEEYITTDRAIAVITEGSSPREEQHEAPSGAVFLFSHFIVEHVGENQRNLPTRGLNPPTNQAFRPYYKEELLERPQLDVISDGFKVNGEDLAKYHQVYYDKGLNGSVYDGKVSGWLVNTIPADFESTEATYEVSYGDGTTTWRFTE
jgi:hypothetical protein